jgi:hypothetical protein
MTARTDETPNANKRGTETLTVTDNVAHTKRRKLGNGKQGCVVYIMQHYLVLYVFQSS